MANSLYVHKESNADFHDAVADESMQLTISYIDNETADSHRRRANYEMKIGMDINALFSFSMSTTFEQN